MLVQINIPLAKAQRFPVSLPIDGGILQITISLRYNKIAGYWYMAVYDAANTLLLDSVPLLTGSHPSSNILMPHGYLGIGSAYVINTASAPDDWPDSQGFLNGNFALWWGDTAA